MAYSWQHVLSSRPARRSHVAGDSSIYGGPKGCIKYEFPERDENGNLAVRETHSISNDAVKRGLSGPPLHIHLRQTEHFQVEQGKLGLRLGVKELVLSPGEKIAIPFGSRHTFFPHPSSTEDIVFRCWVTPETGKDIDSGLDEVFLRNFASYLMDCERDNLNPSLFQLLVFLWNADIVLTPPFPVPIFVLMGLHYFLARIVGEIILGYRSSYPEYAHTILRKDKAT